MTPRLLLLASTLIYGACADPAGPDPTSPDDTGPPDHDTASPIDDTGTPGDDTGTPPDDSDAATIDGCWITTTDTGHTLLELQQHDDGRVTGTLTWQGTGYPLQDGRLDADGLRFAVHWTDFDQHCEYDFDDVSPTALAGTSDCASAWGDHLQAITADRSCP